MLLLVVVQGYQGLITVHLSYTTTIVNKNRKQAELGVPHSKSKFSGPDQNVL